MLRRIGADFKPILSAGRKSELRSAKKQGLMDAAAVRLNHHANYGSALQGLMCQRFIGRFPRTISSGRELKSSAKLSLP